MNNIYDIPGTMELLYQQIDKSMLSKPHIVAMVNTYHSEFNTPLVFGLCSVSMVVIAGFVVLFLAIIFIQYILSSYQWSRVWAQISFKNVKQPPTDSETKIRQDVQPYQFPPLKEKTSTRMAMGLKRLDESNWLTLDSKYLPEHALRHNLLSTRHPDVVQCLPGSEAACREVLELVTSFLSTRFPQHFTITPSPTGPRITNHLTNETYSVGASCPNPLEIAARLSMEDFNILIRDPESGEYHLQASATLFPAGWKLQERIGTSMANLHRPVPGWKQKLGSCVNRFVVRYQVFWISANFNRYFDHLSHKTAMERQNVFIQTTPHFFQDAPELLSDSPITAVELQVRRERQTFLRLEHSGAVLFTVRTFMEPLNQLDDTELRALRSQVLGWEDEVRVYKGGDIWGPPLLSHCEKRLGPVEMKTDS